MYVFLYVDIRSPSSDRMYKNALKYTCIDKDVCTVKAPHLLAAMSTDEVQLFDERYMTPMIRWKGPKGAYMLSSVVDTFEISNACSWSTLDLQTPILCSKIP